MRQRENKQSGMTMLIEMLIVLAIIAIGFAVTVPSILRIHQVQNENAAAEELAQIGAAEFSMMQLYGVAVAPPNLTGTLALPLACNNPMLASGAQIQPPNGYGLIFTPGAAATSSVSACSTIAGFQTYSIALDPTNVLSAGRHFLAGSDQIIHFADGRPATSTDPIYLVAVPTTGQVSTILSVQNTGTGTPTNPVTPPVVPPPAFSYTGSVVLDMPAGENFVVPLFGVATTITDVSASGGTCASCTDTVASAKTITGITITWNGGSLPPAAVGFRLWLPDDGNNNTAAGDYNYGNANCTNFTAIGSQCQLSISNLAATPTMPIGLLLVSNNGNLTGANFSWTVQTMN